MNPLEIRKIIAIGWEAAAPDGPPILDAQGMPQTVLPGEFVMTVAFWVPQKQPHQRCEGRTAVIGAQPHELQALKDGAIAERIQKFTFCRQPTAEESRRKLLSYWERWTLESLGFVPNQPPIDRDPKRKVEFSPV